VQEKTVGQLKEAQEAIRKLRTKLRIDYELKSSLSYFAEQNYLLALNALETAEQNLSLAQLHQSNGIEI
jgi:hypothetical protein